MSGPPQVPITRPALGEEAVLAVARVVRSGWIMQGPEVAAFEQELAAAVGAPHAVAVSSGTGALELALRLCDVGPGDEVITVSHSFIATANAVRAVGATPVFVDVDPDNYGLDPARLDMALSPRTRAILPVHQVGFPCAIERIVAFARDHGLAVVEDAACAIGSELRPGERLGRPHGRLACFSFHPRKVLTTGDGGMITTADAALAARARALRSHGMSLPPEVRQRNPAARESYTEPGFNLRMTDLSAAIGRTQLARLDDALAERRRIADRFTAALRHHPVLAPPAVAPDARPNYQSYPAHVRPESSASAEEVLAFLHARGIGARRGITNAHEEPAYAGSERARVPAPLTVSERLARTTILLPLFHGMRPDEESTVLAGLEALRPDRASP